MDVIRCYRASWFAAAIFLGFTVVGCSKPDTPIPLKNGSFEQWFKGPQQDPDGWTRFAGIGIVQRSDSEKHGGQYALRLTRKDANVNLFQALHPPRQAENPISCFAWAYVLEPTSVRLDVGDDSSMDYSEWHNGGNAWEQLVVVHNQNANAKNLRVLLDVSREANSTAPLTELSAIFDEVTCVVLGDR